MAVNQEGIPMIRNGNQAIAFMGGKDVAKYFNGYMDNAALNMWYEEDPLKNHLGLMSFWNQESKDQAVTFFDTLMQNKSVLEVNGWEGSFTYDIPIEQDYGCYTEEDMSHQEFAGIDGSIFYIVLSKEFAPGTTLGYDDTDGMQIIVAEEEEVQPTGTGYKHPVKLVTKDKRAYFPAAKLGKGIQYFDVAHAFPEYGTKFAKVQLPDTPGSHRFEFRLGSLMGVESYITGKADSYSTDEGWMTASSTEYLNDIKSEMDSHGWGDFVVRMDIGADGRPNLASANIGSTMEFLTQKYLHKLMGTKLLFQRAGEIKSTNGVIRLNEGLWHQIRRGRIIEYGRPGGITKLHIAEAAEYVFRNSKLRYENRRIKFKCGTQAYYNVLDLFEKEVQEQLGRIGLLLGSDRVLPKSPVSGSSLQDLMLEPVTFTKVYLPQIGVVDIEWDPSLDNAGRSDRFSGGMHPNGKDWTTYSMIIWDASSSEYSNRGEGLPQGTSLVEGGNANSNVFLVKPQGPMIYTGTRNGRYDMARNRDIAAAGKYVGQEFFAYSNIECFLRDPSVFVTIELSRAARKGFN